ncbi:MAG: hypothetical protein GXP01_09515 [Alphaproteobacteria bacterium]|nr:hypothetical protein [Alphaproteobacteria bacterium]
MRNIFVFAAAFVAATGFVASANAHTAVYDYGTDPGDYDYALNGEYPDLPDHVYFGFNSHNTHPTPNPYNSLGQKGFLKTYSGCNVNGSTSARMSIASLTSSGKCKKDFQGQYSAEGFDIPAFLWFPAVHVETYYQPHADVFSNGTAN